MALHSTNINSGHCQGIIAGNVYSPKTGVALVTLKVKGGNADPETKKRPLYFIQLLLMTVWQRSLSKKGRRVVSCTFTFTFQRITERTKTAFQLFIITELPIGPSSVK